MYLSDELETQARSILKPLESINLTDLELSDEYKDIFEKYLNFLKSLPVEKKRQLYLKTLLRLDGIQYLELENDGIYTIEELIEKSVDKSLEDIIRLPEIKGVSQQTYTLLLERLKSIGITRPSEILENPRKFVQSNQSRESKFSTDQQKLLIELDNLHQKLNCKPTINHWNKFTQYTLADVQDSFGSWSNFLQQAGFNEVLERVSARVFSEIKVSNVGRAKLIRNLRELTENLGRKPKRTEYNTKYSKNGDALADEFRVIFGTWNEFIKQSEIMEIISQVREEAEAAKKKAKTAKKRAKAAKKRAKARKKAGIIISENSVKDDLERVKFRINRIPTYQDYKDYGRFKVKILHGFFGRKWEQVLMNGLGASKDEVKITLSRKRHKISSYLERLIEMIERFNNITPTWMMARYYGVNVPRLVESFGSWRKVLAKAKKIKLDRERISSLSETDLNDELDRVCRLLGRVPAYKEFNQYSNIGIETIVKGLGKGSYSKTVSAVRKQLSGKSRKIPDSDLFAELRRIEKVVARVPLGVDWKKHGKCSVQTTHHRFGKWIDFLQAAGYTASQLKESKKEFWKSKKVLSKTSDKFTAKDLIVIYKRMRNEVSGQIYLTEFLAYAKCSASYLYKFFKGFKNLVEESGFEYVVKKRQRKISAEDIKVDILNLYKQLGHLPNVTEYRGSGKYDYRTVYKNLEIKHWREIKDKCLIEQIEI